MRCVSLLRRTALLLLLAASPAWGQRQSLGVFGAWGAFRDGGRCYAIAEPADAPAAEGWRPFASVGHWPGRRGGQLHIRLSRAKRAGSAVLARIDGRSFQLVGGGRDAWARTAAATPRSGGDAHRLDLLIQTRSTAGRLVSDHYRLRGAATAIDAAAIACAPRR